MPACFAKSVGDRDFFRHPYDLPVLKGLILHITDIGFRKRFSDISACDIAPAFRAWRDIIVQTRPHAPYDSQVSDHFADPLYRSGYVLMHLLPPADLQLKSLIVFGVSPSAVLMLVFRIVICAVQVLCYHLFSQIHSCAEQVKNDSVLPG